MNLLPLQNFLNPAFILLKEQIFKPLSAKQKKMTLVALAIFSAMASCLLIFRFYFQAKRQDQVNPHAKNEREIPVNVQPQLERPKDKSWREMTPSFPTQHAASKIIYENDSFLEVLSPFDRQIRMKSLDHVSNENFLSFYVNQIKECTTHEQERIHTYLENINRKLKEFGIQLPETIHFIKTTGKEEIPGTAAYCRHHAIIFNYMSERLLAHELFHIYSSCNPEMRRQLYALIGYQLIPPLSVPFQLEDKRLVNPDVPYLNAYITVQWKGDKVQAVPIDLYDLNYQGLGKNQFLQGVYHKFAVVEPQEKGVMKFKWDEGGSPILFDFDEAEDLKSQIGQNTSYVDSPEEILADNFAMMIMGEKPQSEELIEKMKACFQNNRTI